MNHFELFGIPVRFRVDKGELARLYFELQKKYHPDFFTQETEAEQAEALERSSQINQALKILRDPDETIRYVLQLKGMLEDDEKYPLPPEFLMEMMELNEDLGEGSRERINQLETGLYRAVEPILEQYSEGNTPESDLGKVKDYYYKKKYLKRILDRLEG
ncbi:MAG: Fe-S protein assembly co-chaperone HscB [Chitinophagaceae bacterium]|nr:Fe-S protein assembly co-chaperone HscB [Chitinophagaceae bacterium]